jgi:hypothetical protein
MSRPLGRRAYPSDVTDGEWEFLAPYLTLMTEDAPQRVYDLREVFNALRYVMRTGCPWRYLPNDFPLGGGLSADRVPTPAWVAGWRQAALKPSFTI